MATDWQFTDARLLVFAKAPVPGRVKTRLARGYGYREAARVYRRLLRERLAALMAARLAPIELWCAPDSHHPFFAHCRRTFGVSLHRQRQGDLGTRMRHAVRSALTRGERVVILGGDCVSVTNSQIRQACKALGEEYPVVLGPAEDGGYVLIGVNDDYPLLFRPLPWGTARVLAATRQRLQRATLPWWELPLGWDVDEPADLRRLKHRGYRVWTPITEMPR